MDTLTVFYIVCIVVAAIGIVYNYVALQNDKREAGSR